MIDFVFDESFGFFFKMHLRARVAALFSLALTASAVLQTSFTHERLLLLQYLSREARERK